MHDIWLFTSLCQIQCRSFTFRKTWKWLRRFLMPKCPYLPSPTWRTVDVPTLNESLLNDAVRAHEMRAALQRQRFRGSLLFIFVILLFTVISVISDILQRMSACSFKGPLMFCFILIDILWKQLMFVNLLICSYVTLTWVTC